MNEISVFSNDQFGELRTVIIHSQPWFVAADVCKALDISNPSKAIQRLDPDEKMTLTSSEARFETAPDKDVTSTDTHPGQRGGAQFYSVVSEPGLYSLVLGSRKPEARQFKRWVTHDVIPSIRAHGGYLTPALTEQFLSDPDTLIRLATDLKNERTARLAAEARIAADAPKVLFADAVSQSDDEILVGDLAKLIKQNGTDIGQNRLYRILRQDGFIMSGSTMPTQKAMNLGLFRVIERTVSDGSGKIRLTTTTKVTGKGQLYFLNRYAPDRGFLSDLN